jgi:hypothetical protein
MNAARFAIVLALFAQTSTPSLRNVLNADRALTPAEIADVLSASRRVLANKTFRVSFAEVLMGRAGRPRLIRSSGAIMGGIVYGIAPGDTSRTPTHVEWREERTTITDFTGRPARRCDGSAVAGELVVEYVHSSLINAWTTTARAETNETRPLPWQWVFGMLGGTTPATSGERKQIGARWARALVAPWTPLTTTTGPPEQVELTGDPLPNVPGDPVHPVSKELTQTLWIDVESLLPLRWETTHGHEINLTYERLDLQRPAGVRAPDCIR